MLITHNFSLSDGASSKEDEKELEFAFICVDNQVDFLKKQIITPTPNLIDFIGGHQCSWNLT